MLSVVSKTPCTFEVFSVPRDTNPDVFDPSVRIVPSGTRRYAPWKRIDVDRPSESIELCQEHGIESCILELSMADTVSQRWEFDRRTGMPYGPVLVSADTIILMSMLEEIGRFRYADALGQVIDLASHHDFNVRWAAARCAGVLDPDVAHQLMRRFVNDPHPILRNMAAGVLRRVNTKGR